MEVTIHYYDDENPAVTTTVVEDDAQNPEILGGGTLDDGTASQGDNTR